MGVINGERLLQTFADMVAIDSPSFHERKMADSIKETFAGLGVELTEDNANAYYGSEAGNLYGRLEVERSCMDRVDDHLWSFGPVYQRIALVFRRMAA